MSDAVEYAYEELIHDHEGILVPCRDCGERVFLKHVASFGCHECEADARDVTIKAKEDDDE